MNLEPNDPLDNLVPANRAGTPWFYWAEPHGREVAGVGVRRSQTFTPQSTRGFDWSGVDVPDEPTFVTVAFDGVDPTGPWRSFAPVELVQPARSVQRRRPPRESDVHGRADTVHFEPGTYPGRVEAALRSIDAGLVDKVVVARVEEMGAADPIETLRALRGAFPGCWIFGRSTGEVAFVGATPERLVSVRGDSVETVALAGTIARGSDSEEDRRLADELLGSGKDQAEHRWVVDAIRSELDPFCDALEVADVPQVRRLENVQHLETEIRGRLSSAGALELVGALHPTPAVCGHPRGDATRLIRELEPFDRGLYAGVVGMLDRGRAELCVGIRSALLEPSRTSLYAGAGIVSGSEPAREAEETATKLQAVGRWLRGAR